jgi:transposase
LLAPPRQAKDYLKSVSPRAKTDRIDCRGLAWFAVTRPKSRTLPEYPLSSEPVEKVEQLLRARRGVVQALMSLRQQLAELPFAAAPLEAAIGALTAQRDQLDADIAAATQVVAPTDVKRLQAIVGVGPVTAHAVAARLAGRSFARADQFVAYVGLDVATCESGKRKGERGLTKRGDAELRRLFYLCAQSAVRSRESPFRALVKHQDEYRPARVYEPADPPKAKGGSGAGPRVA